MLTVNYIDSLGRQTIREAFSVEYLPNAGLVSSSGEKIASGAVAALCPSKLGAGYEHEEWQIYAGDVYVMNGHGKTVAKYRLAGGLTPEEYRLLVECVQDLQPSQAAQLAAA